MKRATAVKPARAPGVEDGLAQMRAPAGLDLVGHPNIPSATVGIVATAIDAPHRGGQTPQHCERRCRAKSHIKGSDPL
jgi:hypothetical protein